MAPLGLRPSLPNCCSSWALAIRQRQRWDGQPDVLGEQCDDAIDVGCLEGPGKPLDQLLLGGGVRRRRRLPAR